MACFIEMGHASSAWFPAVGQAAIQLRSGAFGVKLDGSYNSMVVSTDEPGWLHVSRDQHDKAAIGKSRRILPNVIRGFGGVGSGLFVSFIADSQRDKFTSD